MSEIEMDAIGERVVIDGEEYSVPRPVVHLLLSRSRKLLNAEIKLEKIANEIEDLALSPNNSLTRALKENWIN